MSNTNIFKSHESWIWDAACAIRGARDLPKYRDYIHPNSLKRLSDVLIARDEFNIPFILRK